MPEMTDMQIRAAALAAAVELGKQGAVAHGRASDLHVTVDYARRLEGYIRTGELAPALPGTC